MFYRKHTRVTAPEGGETRTKQSHKDECDINRILSQYKKTGIITHVQSARPEYTDLPSDSDFQASLHIIMEAETTFNALPAKVRNHFNNSPMEFLGAFQDPAQLEYLREHGFLSRAAAVAGADAPPTPPATPTPGNA